MNGISCYIRGYGDGVWVVVAAETYRIERKGKRVK